MNITSKVSIWHFFNNAKVQAVQMNMTSEQLYYLKQECDNLFYQATGSKICPAYWIGGW